MHNNKFPIEGHLVTAISVHDGNARVVAASVIMVNERSIAIEYTGAAAPQVPTRNEQVTLLYSGTDRILRLRTRVSQTVGDNRVVLAPDGPVTEGERREFIRAETTLRLATSVVTDAAQLEGLPRLSLDSAEWQEQTVDLSGSGVSFNATEDFGAGALLYLQFAVGTEPSQILGALGSVVRTEAVDPLGGMYRIAVHFSELTEAGRDILVSAVFKRYLEQLGAVVGRDLAF